MYSELNKQKIITPKLIHPYNFVYPVLFLSNKILNVPISDTRHLVSIQKCMADLSVPEL